MIGSLLLLYLMLFRKVLLLVNGWQFNFREVFMYLIFRKSETLVSTLTKTNFRKF